MGSGLSIQYEIKSYDYLAVSETPESSLPHGIDERLPKYFEKMLAKTSVDNTTYKRNLMETSEKYPINNVGLFGEPGKNHGVRIIKSDDPMLTAMDFFERISNGTKIEMIDNKYGMHCKTADGVRINFRPYTSSINSPAVDISILSNGNGQKIHFILR